MNDGHDVPPKSARIAIGWLLAGGVAAALAVGGWFFFERRPTNTAPALPGSTATVATPAPAAEPPEAIHEPTLKKEGDTFLEAFGEKGAADSEPVGPVLADAALQKRFDALLDLQDQLRALGEQASQWQETVHKKELERALAARDKLLEQLNRGLASFEKELGRARKARPDAAVPAWLTGEVLILIGGEPEEILPHLRRALASGVNQSRLWASLSRTQTEANQFEEGLRSAAKALELAGQDRSAWDAYVRAAFYIERFADVISRLDRAFPKLKPDWAVQVRAEAQARLALWQAEQKLRSTEEAADLPRVRLVVEHRRFARDDKGNPLTRIESTGTGEVVLELFEDQAPAAVANFLSLVMQKKYDGTRFYLAEAATLVEGGDVKSTTADPKDDGRGNPGYFIPDEFALPQARGHYRGSISMVNNGPHTTGSRFFLTLVPMPEMDGAYTVFGRVLKGQAVVDRITRGRTNLQLGRYGRLIPGDLLLRAEVLRKRNHEYRVVKDEMK
jgi:cyclophilin family peptidyl-prolyl cis-trans isomerase